MPTAEQAVAQATRFWEAFGAGDMDVVAETFAPNVRRIGPFAGDEGDGRQGKDEYVAFIANAKKTQPAGYTKNLDAVATPDGRRVYFHGIEVVSPKPGEQASMEVNVVMIMDLNEEGLITLIDIYWKQPASELGWVQADRLEAVAERS